MARLIERLAAEDCIGAAATGKPYYLNDGDGLMLRVSEAGAKSWILRYRLDGSRRDMGLGPLSRYPLSEARAKARKLHRMIDDGIDVAKVEGSRAKRKERAKVRQDIEHREIEESRQRKTFREAAEEYLKATQAARSAQSDATWRQSLRDYVYPVIGDAATGILGTDKILECIGPLWQSKTVTMDKTRGRIEAIIDFAIARNYRKDTSNPARWKGLLENMLVAKSALIETLHYPALAYAEVPQFMRDLRSCDDPAARALELLILAGTPRTGAVVKARWAAIDMASRVWTIPKEDMKIKGHGTHLVPLGPAAMHMLENLPRDGERLFPAIGDKAMYNLLQTFGRVDPRQNKPITVHGFRSSFRDWAYETQTFDHMIVEHCLAHVEGSSSELAYRRGDAIAKRREVMLAWDAFCAPQQA